MQATARKSLTILFWTILILIGSAFYFENMGDYFTGELSPRKAAERWWLVVHFLGAGCTLFLGPLQFIPAFRNRFKKWHRIAGKFYIGGSILSALMVPYLLSNYPLPGSILSLGLLAVIWLFTTCAAFWFALKKDFKQHRHFMIRSYVCGLAFVFIRILPIINEYTGIFNFMQDEDMIFTIYEWICWIYPLMLTEFFLVWWPSIMARRTAEVRVKG
ncbi:MAG TPA: DUF2306 domain-containing protein [Cyclobacteriaceae bacterium]